MWKSIFSAPEIVAGITRWGVFWRGLLVSAIGVLLTLKPLLATFTLSVMFGWGFVIGGIWTAISAFRLKKRKWLWLLYGMLIMTGGIFLLRSPGAELLAFAWSVAALLLTGGVVGVSICLAAHNSSMQNLFCFITSVCSILLGTLIFLFPITGMSELLWVLGVLLAAEGVVLMVFASRMPQNAGIGMKANPIR